MITRKGNDVERVDVGKPFGMPEGKMIIQWYFSRGTGDEKYHHNFAVRKYTLIPGLTETPPFHYHKYVQAPFIISGRMRFETPDDSVEVGPGDEVIFAENEPHRAIAIGDEPVEMICIIDCPDGGDCCDPDAPQEGIVGLLK
jgi:quercetin dioxygenase-like cupin family protein